MNISFIIPNYNGESLLKKNLPVLFNELNTYKRGKVEVIVIDDLSKDNSIDILENLSKKYENLKILKNDKNLGFSPTVNKGAREATGDILILLNTDIYPNTGFLDPLLNHFRDEDVFAVGCMDKSIEEGKTILRGRGLGQWKRGFLVHKRGETDKNNTLWVSGGSGAFRKKIWDTLGGLNELYAPFYWEDIDLSYRALKSGYKVLFERKSVVVHEHEKGSIKSSFTEKEIRTIALRNQFIFVWENATDYSLQIAHFIWLPYHFLKAILNRDTVFFLAFFKALIMLPKIIKSSLKYQSNFVKKDSEIIKNLSK